MIRDNLKHYGLMLAACASLWACETASTVATAASAATNLDLMSYFLDDVNVMEKNYAAADFMADRARGFVSKNNIIKALPLLDSDEPRLMTEFGHEMPEQVGRRLNEIGYKVDLTDVMTGPGYDETGRGVRRISLGDPDYILTGAYKRQRSTVDVVYKIQDARTGIERAAFNYSMPRRGALRDSVKPEPMITRIEDGNMAPDAVQIEAIPESGVRGNK
jgi:hypothetical protein